VSTDGSIHTEYREIDQPILGMDRRSASESDCGKREQRTASHGDLQPKGELKGGSRRCSAPPTCATLLSLHLLAAAAPRIEVAALAGLSTLGHLDFAAALGVGTAIRFTLFQCHDFLHLTIRKSS